MPEEFQTISPVDGSVVATIEYATNKAINNAIEVATTAQKLWAKFSVAKRIEICEKAMEYLIVERDQIAEEITWQIGRPIKYAGAEISGVEERMRYLMQVADQQLSSEQLSSDKDFIRAIKRESKGVVFTIVPWNYPYLTAINSIAPALLAGNAVILKHSPQTPLCAKRLMDAFNNAGMPAGVLQSLYMKDVDIPNVLSLSEIDMVCFTGSIRVGRLIEQHVAGYFKSTNLELGGKDPAYVRHDAKLQYAIDQLVDGAFFNSGQSCCAVERIYVHETLYREFLAGFIERTEQLVLGNPLHTDTTLGPVVSIDASDRILQQIRDAEEHGAKRCINPEKFAMASEGTSYLAPEVLTDVNKNMSVMHEETFGPVVTVTPVGGDQEAIKLMNDSVYGLTASLWTDDADKAELIGDALETGTVFTNRCDYLDPELPWIGVKDSGSGFSLSRYTFDQMTRPKSYHFKLLQ